MRPCLSELVNVVFSAAGVRCLLFLGGGRHAQDHGALSGCIRWSQRRFDFPLSSLLMRRAGADHGETSRRRDDGGGLVCMGCIGAPAAMAANHASDCTPVPAGGYARGHVWEHADTSNERGSVVDVDEDPASCWLARAWKEDRTRKERPARTPPRQERATPRTIRGKEA